MVNKKISEEAYRALIKISKKKKHVHIKELKSWIKEKESEFSAAGFSLFNQKIFLYKLVLKDFINRFLGV